MTIERKTSAECDTKTSKNHEFVLSVQNFAVTLQPIRHYALTFLTKSITTQNVTNKMIIVPVKDGENIEKALKKFKRKAEKTGIIKEVRTRKQYEKPSVTKRVKMQHAIYVNKLHTAEE